MKRGEFPGLLAASALSSLSVLTLEDVSPGDLLYVAHCAQCSAVLEVAAPRSLLHLDD
jgi:hypothetical protein